MRKFTWDDFADWYLEISKFENNGQKDKILNFILRDLLKLWHPFMPFVTEKIWQNMGNEKMLMVEKWLDDKFYNDIIKRSAPRTYNFEPIQKIINAIRKERSEHNIEPSKKIKAVIYYTERHFSIIDNIRENEVLIKKLKTGIDELEIKEKGERIKNAIYTTVDGFDIYLIDAIDFEKEKERIKGEIDEVEKYIKQIEGKLNNQEFVNNAPDAVVSKEREKLAAQKERLGKLEESSKI